MRLEDATERIKSLVMQEIRKGWTNKEISEKWGFTLGEIEAFRLKYQYFLIRWKPFKQASWDENKKQD